MSSKMASTNSHKDQPFFAENLKILYISDYTILFKFHQHIVQMLIK